MTSPRPSIWTRGRLRAVEVVEALVDAVADELLQLGLEPVLERVAHAPISRITLPAWPSLMTWMASAMRLEREAVGDDGAGVELAGAEEAPHLVPGLVHLAAGDAVEGESLEDHVAGEVHLGRPARACPAG